MSELRPRSARANPGAAGIARHGRLRKRGPWGTIFAFIAASLAVLLLSGGVLASIVSTQLLGNTEETLIVADTEGPPPSIGAYPGGFNMLIVGSDQCEEEDTSQCGLRGTGKLNDVTMLLHVSADGTHATAVSFPRDLVVPIPSCPKEDGSGNYSAMTGRPINETLFYGGLACTVLTVEQLTGLKIQFAGLITFNGVIKMANAVGGVPVCLTADLNDPYVGLELAAGEHSLRGKDALKFLRSRHGVGDGSDLTRISSQQVYLSSLVRTLKSKDTLSDPFKVYKIAQAATSSMQLSRGLKQLDTLASIAARLKDVPLENVTFVQFPSTTGVGGIYEGKVAPVQNRVDELFAKIQADEPFRLAAAGDDRGSTVNTNAPKPPSDAEPDADADKPADGEKPTDADKPADPDEPTTIEGVKGQTAADYTCAVPN